MIIAILLLLVKFSYFSYVYFLKTQRLDVTTAYREAANVIVVFSHFAFYIFLIF